MHPDFYLPKFGIYLEYLGLFKNDLGYRCIASKKMKLYSEFNVPIIFIFPPRNMKHSSKLRWLERKLISKISAKTGTNIDLKD